MFMPFDALTHHQKAHATALRPGWKYDQLRRFEFWITKAGNVSRRYGHHRLTAAEAKALDDALRIAPSSANSAPTETKDQPRRVTGTPAMHLGSNRD